MPTDFIKHWQVNIAEESAIHATGLRFRHIKEGEDGVDKLEVSGLPQWIRFCKSQGVTVEQCQKLQKQLREEFIEIYRQIIAAPKINFVHKIPEDTRS